MSRGSLRDASRRRRPALLGYRGVPKPLAFSTFSRLRRTLPSDTCRATTHWGEGTTRDFPHQVGPHQVKWQCGRVHGEGASPRPRHAACVRAPCVWPTPPAPSSAPRSARLRCANTMRVPTQTVQLPSDLRAAVPAAQRGRAALNNRTTPSLDLFGGARAKSSAPARRVTTSPPKGAVLARPTPRSLPAHLRAC